MARHDEKALGTFLRDRRMRLDPVSFGFPTGRRRTPGLRREEVAQRANISPTWYTWLEQGRGGAPSPDVLERIAAGMMLTEPEREHLHLLAFGHPPGPQKARAGDAITPRLQRVLDAMEGSAALIRTATWDVLAWNRAATMLLTDYSKLAPEQRNVLRMLFSDSAAKAAQADWRQVARYVVAAFRADAARAGAGEEIRQLVAELSETSAEFAAYWRDNEVVGQGEGVKRLHQARLGPVTFEFSTFSVDARPDLNLMVYTPADHDARRVADYLAGG